MEIQTAPRRPTVSPWGRWTLAAVVLGPVAVLALLPTALGLQRYVVTGEAMRGSIDRGSVVFERSVPVGDVRPGDVVTYRTPASASVDGTVTHRVVSVGPDGIVTQADAADAPDPWTLQPDDSTVSRVAFSVPVLGWLYIALLRTDGWILTAVSASALLLLLLWGRLR